MNDLMATEIIDSQLLAENVVFLDSSFDQSFKNNTISVVKGYTADDECLSNITQKNKAKRKNLNYSHCSGSIEAIDLSQKQCEIGKKIFSLNLRDWGLPFEILKRYEEKGIVNMFHWQAECLSNTKILLDNANLIYSAPTSAGKTLVAEILLIKTVLERQKKVIVILPFVSIVREKMFYLQDVLTTSGIRVEGFMGSHSPPGGLHSVHAGICTIEKANSLINKLLDEGNISELGAVIIDEMHLLGDPHRGYILELLLTKIKYVTTINNNINIQIIGMSATLPNLEDLAEWLDAELYVTQFRPIPLEEYCLVGSKYFDKDGVCVNTMADLEHAENDTDKVLKICLDTIKQNCSVLIFCMTKNRCESLAQSIASSFFKIGCLNDYTAIMLREQLKPELIMEVMEQLKNCPVGLDQFLKSSIAFGVAFHHAGLTFDERDIIENGFKTGAIRVLLATSTLSSGVNLPARTVIIRSPVFQRQPINILTYKQMAGRAGRMGKDERGDSILICTESEKNIGFELMSGSLNSVNSCIDNEDKFLRAILEIIASQVANSKYELDVYAKSSLLYKQKKDSFKQMLDDTLEELQNLELVRVQSNEREDETSCYVATPLGKACLFSSMGPNDGLSLFCELQRARQCLVLETDLHLIYLVTPYSVSNQWVDLDWLHLSTLWESMTKAMKRVGELIGIQDSFIIQCVRGTKNLKNAQHKINIHKRFYTALALQDLVNEVPLSEVAMKFRCARGFLQSLQQAASTFAGMVTSFCHQLGWKNMELLISQFQDRLHFGIHFELLDLMKLQSLNGVRARALFDANYCTIASIAGADVNSIENVLYKAIPFLSEKQRDDDDKSDMNKRKQIKNFYITGCRSMTSKEAAENLILEARKHLENDIGIVDIKWKKDLIINEKSNEVVPKDETILVGAGRDSKNTSCLNDINKTFIKTDMDSLENIFVDPSNQSPANIVEELKENSSIYKKPNQKILHQTSSTPVEEQKSKTENPHEEMTWDTLNITELALSDITKINRFSDKVLSPDVSFGEQEKTSHSVSKKNECSINLSDSSFFDDSLIREIEKDEIIDRIAKNDDKCSYINCKANGSSNITPNKTNKKFINYMQTDLEPITVYKSPVKRPIAIAKDSPSGEPIAKKQCEDTNHHFKDLKANLLTIGGLELNCFVLQHDDINKFIKSFTPKSMFLNAQTYKRLEYAIAGQFLKPNGFDQSCQNDYSLNGMALYDGDVTCIYLDFTSLKDATNKIHAKIKELIHEKCCLLKIFSYKKDYYDLKLNLGLELNVNCTDISLIEWLIDNNERIPSVNDLMVKYCSMNLNTTPIKQNNVVTDYKNLDIVMKTCVNAWSVLMISKAQEMHLNGQYGSIGKILSTEIKISKILADCELSGLIVNRELASQLLMDVKSSQDILQKKAYNMCGRHFNFMSSKDVAKVLGFYKGRKVSTKKSILSLHDSPLSYMIMNWRKLNAILTKTLYPLTEKACVYSRHNRIHPAYTTFTCTGRISMHEPNLQSVPRTFSIPHLHLTTDKNSVSEDVVEFNCRNIFEADAGCVLVSADYCQLEMRVLTHYSEDPVLMRVMKSKVEVFKSVAASWAGVSEDLVDDDLRQKAKQLCYGILYGMGNKTLSQQLDVSEMEASVFMDTFYKTYPTLKKFAQSLVESCRKCGYVETLMKRRRYLPDINSTVVSKKNAAERQAVNTTIQGSAADVAKAAMCAIEDALNARLEPKPRLVLQLHDELIYEVPSNEVDDFKKTLRCAMENTVSLRVPLTVRVKVGHTWGSLEDTP